MPEGLLKPTHLEHALAVGVHQEAIADHALAVALQDGGLCVQENSHAVLQEELPPLQAPLLHLYTNHSSSTIVHIRWCLKLSQALLERQKMCQKSKVT